MEIHHEKKDLKLPPAHYTPAELAPGLELAKARIDYVLKEASLKIDPKDVERKLLMKDLINAVQIGLDDLYSGDKKS